MKIHSYIPLGFFPTPVHTLPNLNNEFPDYHLFMKRDDQTGLAFGGNKTRKLEYLMKDAINKGADTVVTVGAVQSNHCRQTAAAAAQMGLNCELLLRGTEPDESNGNYFLDKVLGAEIHWFEPGEMDSKVDEVLSTLKLKGKNPYYIPIGGSNAVGTIGYIRAMEEIQEQLNELSIHLDYIVFASCSGGTHSGMAIGQKLFLPDIEVQGISIEKDENPDATLLDHIVTIANESVGILGLDVLIHKKDIQLIQGYNEAGYSVITDQEVNAIHKLAKAEGIILDPVYSGRAFSGFLDMLQNRKYPKGSNILFWHTGGGPANFSSAQELL